MILTDLPDEILMIIVQDLDLTSNYNLYNTCEHLRNLIRSYGVIKVCEMSLNTMATAVTLKLNFFKDISSHIQVLNMCGVPDLCKTSLLSVMNKLKMLQTLHVQYTNITIIDLIEIYELCPTIKDIGINFVFDKNKLYILPKNIQDQCQKLFSNFEYIHFVGSTGALLYSKLSMHLLQKAKLKKLKFTITECSFITNENHDYDCMPQFTQFDLYLLDWKAPINYYGSLSELPIFSKMTFIDFEFIVIFQENFNVFQVYASKLFTEFFKINFNVDVETDYTNKPLGLNVCIMIWEKRSMSFDDRFFKILFNRVKNFFPYYCSSNNRSPLPTNYDWYYMSVILNEESKCLDTFDGTLSKRKRIALPNCILNYDTLFKNKQKIQLSLNFQRLDKNTAALTANCDYLKKLTFLSLSGVVRYSSEFFNILFRCCSNLITLNVETSTLSTNSSMIARSIPLSNCIKNLRIVDKRIDFKTIFSSLSQCKTLENIHLLDMSSAAIIDVTNSRTLFENCNKLYNLFIYSEITDSAKVKNCRILKKAKMQCQRHYLNIDIVIKQAYYKFGYDPYIAVFKLNPIKEL